MDREAELKASIESKAIESNKIQSEIQKIE